MSFNKSHVEFSKTHAIPKITADYLSGNPNLDAFVKAIPSLDSFEKIIGTRKSLKMNRSLLVEVLKDQNSSATDLAKKNIELLQKENTFTITTGHQLNIFTGPLFFIYKIITTLKLTDTLNKKYPEHHFVPVYWLNGEDHDFEEINHTYIYGKRVEWKTDQKGATGRMSCKGMAEVILVAETILGDNPTGKKMISLFKDAYKETNTLRQAGRILVNALFGKYGLVIIDGDDAKLKKEFVPIIKDDLVNHTAYRKISETILQLEKEYELPVHPREINLFYLGDSSRERIVKEDSAWKVLNTSVIWKQDELMKEVEEFPERFSPNVVLRPLYQEFVLPNVAYIGGPSEVAYWLEYKEMFDYYKVGYPIPVLRDCVMIVDEVSSSRLMKLGFNNDQLFTSTDDMIKDYLQRKSDEFSMMEETEQISSIFNTLKSKITEIDASLVASVEAERQKQLNSFRTLEEKVIRAQKKAHETEVQQIQKLKTKFFSGKSLQERVDNFTPYYIKYGEAFFDELLNHFNPPEKSFIVLTETKV